MLRLSYIFTFFSFFSFFFFFFNDTATTEIYTLSLHDALPICPHAFLFQPMALLSFCLCLRGPGGGLQKRVILGRDAALAGRSEEHTSELQSLTNLVCRLLLEIREHTSELQSLTNLVCRRLLEK